ncbi:hypothetical protein Pst134EB_004113 [Puccinia striiformis f. sp. tritici]|uniref:BRCT domain-containing protein n=2 Tax=Puccinia striiformis f. sp. tritici TaxID=168172 RepID=A0A0L0W4L6_9BASI|nr:hypothetical protein Pst134EB_004113 [Puccinia striiformis f. sp. tritici]KNF06458.1 hypothetical protein PSTG_00338 [Puccinia striiformis f. sp. tritici PST-78]
MAFGHKRGGTKVNGAKLKPALPPPPPIKAGSNHINTGKGKNSKKGKEKESTKVVVDEEKEDQYDRNFMESIRRDKPPLTGCVVCLSGISDPVRSQAIAYAEKLGAKIEKALTMDVTHLICDRPGSDKYNVALKHSIRVMLPLWLETLYSSFTEGEDIDLNDITQRYTMKPFHTLKLAITGRASSSRTPFIKLAEDNGAIVSIDLEIDCTHLIVLSLAPPNETDPTIFEIEKVQAARKAANIKVVWQEWLEDCVQRQGSLPEDPYLVIENAPRPGRLVHLDPEFVNDAAIDPKEFVRAGIQGHKFETAVTRRNFNSGSQNAIMASIIAQQDLPLRRHPSNLSFKSADAEGHRKRLEEDLPHIFPRKMTLSEQPPPCSHASANSSTVSHALLKDLSKDVGPASIVKKLRCAKSEKFGNPSSTSGTETTSHRTVPGLFRGLKISSIGCPPLHQRKIATLVTQCDGQFTEIHSMADYTVVPLINPPSIPSGCNPVGHHWVEQSLFERKVIDPDKHWSGRPVRLDPFPNPEQYSFSSCGFTDVEEHIIQQIIKKLNLKFVEHPRRSEVSHFFVGPVEGSSRVNRVKSWTDKVMVDFEWLVRKCNGDRILRSSRPPSLARGSRTTPESLDNNLAPDTNDIPLSECVIFMTRKGSLHPNSKFLTDCRKLGARVVDKLNETVTHVVHATERANDPLRELKWARSRNLFIVHPHWLSECKTKLTRADELEFPATYDPQRALSYCAPPSTEITMADVTFNSISEEVSRSTSRRTHELSESILEQDERFYQSPNSRAPVEPVTNGTTPAIAKVADEATEQSERMPESDDQQNHRPPSSHYAASPRSNICPTSSPSRQAVLGVDTQLGGFMEILQQGNIDLTGKVKEKDNRKSRKRGIDESSRGSDHQVAAEEGHPSVANMSNGLHRTMSEFSHHSSAAASQIGGYHERNSFEESMDVTWEDPAAKREILKAINDPSCLTTRKTIIRRQQVPQKSAALVDSPTSDSNLHPNRNHSRISSKTHSVKDVENLQNDITSNADSQEITILPPLKNKRPRLIGHEQN